MHIAYFHDQRLGLQLAVLSSRALRTAIGKMRRKHTHFNQNKAGKAGARRACLGRANHFLFSDVSRAGDYEVAEKRSRLPARWDLGDPGLSQAQTPDTLRERDRDPSWLALLRARPAYPRVLMKPLTEPSAYRDTMSPM